MTRKVAALSLVSLAVARAQEGRKVVLADLVSGAPAARLLDTKAPGVRSVSVHDAHLIVAVPDRDDVAPAGPLGRPAAGAERSTIHRGREQCLRLRGPDAHPGHPGSLARRGAPRDLGDQRRRGGDRRPLVVGQDPRRRAR